ncbi:hypothetical protein [Glutamicibacter halophytocola]|uniref:hypothetical protein n=1 Tax=Glutamicibacter halophytocola TaxID=1933880 RepID=UPI0015C55531|nr:hypothetical protein [Glutamicibacter halophytocola]NQD41429.1 hypothetical protein [Glutamicibacter halophytocola]
MRESYSETPEELPKAVLDLIDNKAYLPRHKKLKRLYGDKVLLKLAELAATKGKPSHWYAKVTSIEKWEQTFEMVKTLIANSRRALVAMEKLGAEASFLPWYIKTVAALSEAQVAGFIERATRAKSPPKLFAYLSKQTLS